MGVDENEIADQLARQSFSHPPIGPEPALGTSICTKVTRGVIRDWTSRKHKEHWQFTHGQRQAKDRQLWLSTCVFVHNLQRIKRHSTPFVST
jgi:hypothetical protein